jgi:hypothetical protein
MGQLESSTAARLIGGPSDRFRVRRNPNKGRCEPHRIEAILDRAMVAHVAFVDRDEPVCIPMLCARVGQQVDLHGSRASRAMRRLAAGERACVAVTVLDGLVLARSAFEHNANHEPVVVTESSRKRMSILEVPGAGPCCESHGSRRSSARD